MKKVNVCSLMASAVILASLFGISSCDCKSKATSETATKTDKISLQLQDQPSDDPLTLLKKGNQRFMLSKSVNARQDSLRVQELASGQNPHTVIVGCSDSRVSPEVLFDQGLGDLFVIRTAGNVMGHYELGSIEYAAAHLHTKLIVVMGHSSCGAVNAMIEHSGEHAHDVPGHIASIVKALGSGDNVKEVLANRDGEALDMRAVEANVIDGVKQLRGCAPILNELYNSGKVKIIGAIYHIETGEVEYLDI